MITTSETPSSWPYWSLFFCGHFGKATPGSRRLNRDSFIGLGLIAASTLATLALDSLVPHGKLIFIPGMAASVAWILLAFRRYFAQLDELSLRIQYEAIAFAFAMMLLLGVTAGIAAIVTDLSVHPLWIVLADPLRGLGLVLAARKYQ